MPFSWLQRNGEPDPTKKEKTEEEFEVEMANKVSERIKKEISSSMRDELKQTLANDPVLQRLSRSFEEAEQNQVRERQRREQEQEQNRQNQHETEFEDLDPQVRKYTDTRFRETEERAMRAEAREVRRTVFEDLENYEYYTGDVKKKVDEMLDREPVGNQINANIVRNAYKVVVHDHLKEIQEGKLRSRLSGSVSGTSAGAPANTDPNALPTLNAEQKKAAKMFDISEEDYAKQLKEIEREESFV